MTTASLTGARALITGGGSGIGRAITEHLASVGCDVAIHYHSSATSATETAKYAQQAGVRAEIFAADLTDECAATGMVDRAAAFLGGGIDVLVNNAGDLIGRQTLAEGEQTFWRTVYDVNVTSMVLVTRASLRYLATPASIVNLSSLAGRKGGHGGSLAYSTAKGAVLTFTRALSSELGPRGVRVNAVAPGLILGTHFHNTHTTKASAEESISGIPLGRPGTPADVARLVTFLASERDGFITGATIDINGGVYCM
jgi:3-oxoacyl-[acyl-carrier protein] reductase